MIAASDKTLALDDLSVGDEFVSGTHALDEAQIMAFGAAFDPQPFHTDPVQAQDSFFQGLAASGWHTMAITMRLLVESVPLAAGIIGAGAEVRWPRPTRPGDILQVRGKVLEILPSKSKPDRAIVLFRAETVNQDGAVLQELTTRLVAFRRGG